MNRGATGARTKKAAAAAAAAPDTPTGPLSANALTKHCQLRPSCARQCPVAAHTRSHTPMELRLAAAIPSPLCTHHTTAAARAAPTTLCTPHATAAVDTHATTHPSCPVTIAVLHASQPQQHPPRPSAAAAPGRAVSARRWRRLLQRRCRCRLPPAGRRVGRRKTLRAAPAARAAPRCRPPRAKC